MSSRSGWIELFSGLPSSGRRQRQRVVLAVVGDRPLARPDVAQDADVLARAGERLGERLAVPALDHLRAADAEAEDEAPAAEVVHRHRGHRGRGRRARAHLHESPCRA